MLIYEDKILNVLPEQIQVQLKYSNYLYEDVF